MPGSIPRHFIDELIQRVDIVDIIDARVPLKKAGRDFQARCPFHDEKSPSFTVSQVKQFYHCFGCGANGSAIGFLMEYEHLSFPEAVEELAKQAGVEIPYENEPRHNRQRQAETKDLTELLEKANRYFKQQLRQHPAARQAIDYLKERGLSGEIASRFELGFAPEGWDNLIQAFKAGGDLLKQMEAAGLLIRREEGGYYDRFRGRVMFPIRNHRGHTIGFGGRIIDKGEPKYLNSPETPVFHKGSELYGFFAAQSAIKKLGYAIVVEGYMDVVALAQNGVDNAVATLGTATTRQHLNRLFRASPHIVFCFDGDQAGRDAARKAMETAMPEMRDGRQLSFLFLPEGLDPDDFIRQHGYDAFIQAIDSALPLEEFLFQHLRSKTNTNRSDGRARMIDLARPFLAEAAPGAYKELLIRRLGSESGIDDSDYLAGLLKQKPRTVAENTGLPASSAPAKTLHHLVSLLLQYPQLIARLEPIEGLENVNPPGAQLLEKLQGLAIDNTPTTGYLVEHFRDTPFHRTLEKLASRDHQIEAEMLDETFQQMIASVQREVLETAMDSLLEKAGRGSLSDQEKQQLAQFASSRQSLRFDAAEG